MDATRWLAAAPVKTQAEVCTVEGMELQAPFLHNPNVSGCHRTVKRACAGLELAFNATLTWPCNTRRAAPLTQALCANAHGFSLPAGVRCDVKGFVIFGFHAPPRLFDMPKIKSIP